MKKLRVWAVSDTHGFHNLLTIPDNIDVLIFSGDCSNTKSIYQNSLEVKDFLFWLHNNCIDIPHKIFVAGNHDGSVEAGLISIADIEKEGVYYLCNEEITIEGRVFWGSPITPSYGEWAFMRKRGKLAPLWDLIPYDLDVLITHGPPKGILDTTWTKEGSIELHGDKELWNAVVEKKPKFHCFGHFHDNGDIINAGMLKLANDKYPTTFYNSSVVKDGKFGKLYSNGNIFEI